MKTKKSDLTVPAAAPVALDFPFLVTAERSMLRHVEPDVAQTLEGAVSKAKARLQVPATVRGRAGHYEEIDLGLRELIVWQAVRIIRRESPPVHVHEIAPVVALQAPAASESKNTAE